MQSKTNNRVYGTLSNDMDFVRSTLTVLKRWYSTGLEPSSAIEFTESRYPPSSSYVQYHSYLHGIGFLSLQCSLVSVDIIIHFAPNKVAFFFFWHVVRTTKHTTVLTLGSRSVCPWTFSFVACLVSTSQAHPSTTG